MANKKVDLIEFQKDIIKKFDEYNSESDTANIKDNSLTLLTNIDGINFIFFLKELQKISYDTKVEKVFLVNDWIDGFNSLQGNVYTVINFKKFIEFFGINSVEEDGVSSNILYLRQKNDNRIALNVNEIFLEKAKNLKELNSEKDFLKYLNDIKEKGEKISNNNNDIIKSVIDKIKNKKENKILNTNESLIEINKDNIKTKVSIADLVESLYLTGNNEVAIELNVEKLINLLIKISPF